jgi:hypothetical protein
MTPWDRRFVLLRAVLQPLAGIGLGVLASFLESFGPGFFSGNVVGDLVRWAMVFGGAILVLFSVGTGFEGSILVVFAALVVLWFALFTLPQAVERYAFQRRGLVTACVVLEVERRVESYTDSEGHTHSRVYHDHTLDCTNPQVTGMTTGGRAGDAGEQIGVAYDPAGRLDPRPAGSAGDYQAKLRTGGTALAAGLALNLAAWFGIGHRFFEALFNRLFNLWHRWRPRRRRR